MATSQLSSGEIIKHPKYQPKWSPAKSAAINVTNKTTTEGLPEFEMLRQRVKQSTREAGQTATNAIQRRFAALGGLNTGAAIKTEAKALQEAERAGGTQMSQLDIAEISERQRRIESEAATGIQLRQLGIAERELALNEDIAAFNKQLALFEAGQPTDLFSSLFGDDVSFLEGAGAGAATGAAIGSIFPGYGTAIGAGVGGVVGGVASFFD